MKPWYVWLVGVYGPEVGIGETGSWRVVGVFSTRERALEASFPGCGIICLTLDEPWVGGGTLPTEWVGVD
jgi:hypothetical protein